MPCLEVLSLHYVSEFFFANSAYGETYREQALLAIDAVYCSEAAEALGYSERSAQFMELGNFAVMHIYLGSGLIDHIQKMTMAAIAMADMKVWAQRS